MRFALFQKNEPGWCKYSALISNDTALFYLEFPEFSIIHGTNPHISGGENSCLFRAQKIRFFILMHKNINEKNDQMIKTLQFPASNEVPQNMLSFTLESI